MASWLLVLGGIFAPGWGASTGAGAPELGGEVTVLAVEGALVSGPGGRWHETMIEVAARPAPENPTRHVSRVEVVLEIGYETLRGGARGFEAYRAATTAVALPEGRSRFRFYLPPEVVARDRVNGDLRYWFVEIVVAGQPQPTTSRHVGAGLTSPAALERFRAEVGARATQNAGVLRPLHRTPFGFADSGPPAPTPLDLP